MRGGNCDQTYDHVAESLYRIHDKIKRHRGKKACKIIELQEQLGDRHAYLTERKECQSELDFDAREKVREEACYRAQRNEKVAQKAQKSIERSSSVLKDKTA